VVRPSFHNCRMATEREENPFLRPSQDGRSASIITGGSKSKSRSEQRTRSCSHTVDSSTSMLPLVYTQGLLKPRRDAVSISLLVTSLYSTLCSALFFVVALLQPKYGHVVSIRGRFSPSSAALLTAFIAKTIELTFVMVFLAFMGQVLSRRAIQQKGISLASVSMRSWIL
jgi:hypothetical protein